MLRKNIQFFLMFQFFKYTLKNVRLSSCRVDALNYRNRLLIRSHMNFDKILALIFNIKILKVN